MLLLTPDQQKRLVSRLTGLWGKEFKCPLCGGDAIRVGERMFALSEFDTRGFVVGPGQNIIPIVPVTCAICGYTVLVNAIAANLLRANGERKTGKPNGSSLVAADQEQERA